MRTPPRNDVSGWPALRLQAAVSGRLVYEVVGEFPMLDRTTPHSYPAAWERACARRGQSAGAVVIQRADRPRVWNVPVGAPISPKGAVP